MEIEKGHGEFGKAAPELVSFTCLIGPPRVLPYDPLELGVLATAIAAPPDSLSDGPDAEENLYMPAGYTYFGQFIDHDLTLDATSTLNPGDLRDPKKPQNDPVNARSPRFDLDCVYATGPGDRPYMYAVSDDLANGIFANASLLIEPNDLSRASNGRAIIGDKRNDENSIVNQIQQLFIRFHNKVVKQLAETDERLRGGGLFQRAQDEVRWAYQQIIMDDFLPRIIDPVTLDNFLQTKEYALYTTELRSNLPREFVAAAYRFGHSAVRTGYRLNGQQGKGSGTILPIFVDPPAVNVDDSLVGFDPLPTSHVIDNWGRFFPALTPNPGERLMCNLGETVEITDGGEGSIRLQYAYKLDPTMVDPLADLPPKIASQGDVFPESLRSKTNGPSLALLNLLRGNRYGLYSGQQYAAKIGLLPLDEKYLCVRVTEESGNGKRYKFMPISDLSISKDLKLGNAFKDDTPLWFYILAEAQRPLVDFWIDHGKIDLTESHLKGMFDDNLPLDQQLHESRCAGTQLGGVGGRIIVEVFYGLLESDDQSVLNSSRRPQNWHPIWGPGRATVFDLIKYTDPARAPA